MEKTTGTMSRGLCWVLYAKPARRASDGPCWGEPGTILRAYDYANRDEAAAAARDSVRLTGHVGCHRERRNALHELTTGGHEGGISLRKGMVSPSCHLGSSGCRTGSPLGLSSGRPTSWPTLAEMPCADLFFANPTEGRLPKMTPTPAPGGTKPAGHRRPHGPAPTGIRT